MFTEWSAGWLTPVSVCSCSDHGRCALWGGVVHYREGMSPGRESLWHCDLVYLFRSRRKAVWTHTFAEHATFTSPSWYEQFLNILRWGHICEILPAKKVHCQYWSDIVCVWNFFALTGNCDCTNLCRYWPQSFIKCDRTLRK